jgi:group II intron reverse transcriptase/maturase
MRDAETVLNIIRQRGQRGLHLEDAYRQMFNPTLYLRAYSRLYRNRGAMTRGSSLETVDGMSMEKIGSIVELLRHERYRWTPVRRTYIPKSNGRMRPLGIPTWSDKLVQEVMRSILEAYYEPQFSDRSHGFRAGRGCHTALSEIYYTWKGVAWFIEGDIKGCFDNIDHKTLMSIIREKIHDGRFTNLIEQLLEAGYLEEWDYRPTLSGTPQGGVASPILANIYLDRLDQFVASILIPKFTKGGKKRRPNPEYVRLMSRAQRLVSKGEIAEAKELRRAAKHLPSIDPNDPAYRRLWYVRYADDFLLGFVGPRSEADAIKVQIKEFVYDHLKLDLSDEKTLITHARTEKARFLGYDIGTAMSQSRKRINGQIELRLPADTLEGLCGQYMKYGKPIHRKPLTHDDDFTIVARYGSEYRGYYQYYALARNVAWMQKLGWVMRISLLKTLACKHKSTVGKMARKYRNQRVSEEGRILKCFKVIIRRDAQDKPPLVAIFGGFSLKWRKDAVMVDGQKSNKVPYTRTELIQRLLADKCELCGSREAVQVHHVSALRDLQIAGRREKPYWARIMAARKRKTLVLCHRCHVNLHAGRLDGRPRAMK